MGKLPMPMVTKNMVGYGISQNNIINNICPNLDHVHIVRHNHKVSAYHPTKIGHLSPKIPNYTKNMNQHYPKVFGRNMHPNVDAASFPNPTNLSVKVVIEIEEINNTK